MVDTSVLKSCETWSICLSTKKKFIEKLKNIESSSCSCAELDLRISHSILAICEAIADFPSPSAQGNRNTLAYKSVETILQKQTITSDGLTELTQEGKQKLDIAFKTTIGMSLNQFLKAYQLNLIKDELASGSRTKKTAH